MLQFYAHTSLPYNNNIHIKSNRAIRNEHNTSSSVQHNRNASIDSISHRTRSSNHSIQYNSSTGTSNQLNETDPHRLNQRQKQIDIGKNTHGYITYLGTIHKSTRDPRRKYIDQPVTPDKYLSCSKRSFDGMIKKWRKLLHQYETNESNNIIPITPNTTKHQSIDLTPILRITDTVVHKRKPNNSTSNTIHSSNGVVKLIKLSPQSSPSNLLNGSLQFDVDVNSYINDILNDSITHNNSFMHNNIYNVPDHDDIGNVSITALTGVSMSNESPVSVKRSRR